MPNVPSHLDLPRFAHLKQNIEEWVDVFHKTLQRQWTQATQAYNAVWKTSLASERPSTPLLDEAAWYESDTGRLFYAVSGVWVQLGGWSGNTTSTSSNYTMLATDAIVLVDASGGNRTVTVNNGSTYTSRIRAIKKVESSSNTVSVVPSSGSIEGAATYVLTTTEGIAFTSDGSNLWAVSRYS